MSARKLYEAGFTDLVSVVPPKAELAPTTTLKKDARGKVPGVRRLDGRWVGYAWLQADPPTPADVAQWESWGANVGLRGTSFPGLDLDCENESLVRFVIQEATRILGPAPVRTSREPRRLLVYRTEEPFSKVAARITFAGQEHTVEMLGEGRQYLVHGHHPSGTEYGWEGRPLWDWAPDELAEVTADDVLRLFEHLREKLHGRAQVTILGTGETKDAAAPPQEDLRAPSPEDLRTLVAEIPNTFPDRDTYIAVGHAIKAAGGEEAFDIFADWAARWEDGTNEPETVQADWDRMHPPFRVGYGWLQDLAREVADYVPAVDAFEADMEAAIEPGPTTQAGVLDLTDTWVAERLAGRLAPRIRYVPETGHWHVWDGSAWAQDRLNRAEHLIRQALVGLSQEIVERAAATPEKEAKPLYRAAHALQSRTALTKVVPELQAHPSITLTAEQFDADDWLLNTPGGIVDLRTGAMMASDPARLMSKTTAVAPDRSREPTLWLQFLAEATDGDEDLQRYLQKLVGYSLTGSTQEQVLAFIHGPTRTGKSTFLDTIAGVFGTYHESAAADTFAHARSDRHPADLAKLAGARLVTASETQEGRAWDTQRVKSLTGGDRISARFLYQDFFTYRPRYQIVIVGNHEPEVKGVDDAIMRRIHVIPFDHRPDEIDRLLPDKLRSEWPGILAWAIDGCLAWLAEGLQPPAAVTDRTEEYRQEEDPVGLFIEECCDTGDPTAEISREDLYAAWARWCHQQGEDSGTLKQLRRRFRAKEREHGFSDGRVWDGTKHRRGYKGLRLVQEDDAEVWQ